MSENKISSLELADKQKPFYEELIKLISDIETEMKKPIDNTNAVELSHHLTKTVELLGTTPRIMELSKMIHSYLKGLVAEEALLNEKLMNAKQAIQKMFFEGRLARWDGLYERAERSCSALTHRLDGLRSLLSFEKGLHNLGNSQT